MKNKNKRVLKMMVVIFCALVVVVAVYVIYDYKTNYYKSWCPHGDIAITAINQQSRMMGTFWRGCVSTGWEEVSPGARVLLEGIIYQNKQIAKTSESVLLKTVEESPDRSLKGYLGLAKVIEYKSKDKSCFNKGGEIAKSDDQAKIYGNVVDPYADTFSVCMNKGSYIEINRTRYYSEFTK